MMLRIRFLTVLLTGSLTAVSLFTLSGAAAPAPNLGAAATKSPPLEKKIVLIGGTKSHGPGEHDFTNGIPLIGAWLRASPAFASADILTYTGGFPTDPAVLENASTIVLYFDGVQEVPPPLLDPARIAQLQKLMDAGAGLIALHQASTLPAGNTSVPLSDWLGAKRNGMWDRAMGPLSLKLADPAHPIAAGVKDLDYRDEIYPTIEFASGGKVTPIFRTTVTPKLGEAKKKGGAAPGLGEYTVAWAYERRNGGRSFGFTGGHYLDSLKNPNLRQLLVNAIAWTARIEVPSTGIAVIEPVVDVSRVNRREENRVSHSGWGELRWYTSAEMGNTQTMTTGMAILKPGASNPRHFHPNCDEILHVISGKIRHTMNEVAVEMNAGDTVSIPQGVLHNAVNIGSEDAMLAISFSTAYREAVGYDSK